jgi:hypothetical protein
MTTGFPSPCRSQTALRPAPSAAAALFPGAGSLVVAAVSLRRFSASGRQVAAHDAAPRTASADALQRDAALAGQAPGQRRGAHAACPGRLACGRLRRDLSRWRHLRLGWCVRCGRLRRFCSASGLRWGDSRIRIGRGLRLEAFAFAINPGDDGTDRHLRAAFGGDAAQDSARRRIDFHRGLVGLDFEEHVAGLDLVAFRDEPARDSAGRHVHIDLGEDDLACHVTVPL